MTISSWEGYSAGSKPTGKVHPGALEILVCNGVKTEGYKSKKWDSFRDLSFDLVITVCDNAAAEVVDGHASTCVVIFSPIDLPLLCWTRAESALGSP